MIASPSRCASAAQGARPRHRQGARAGPHQRRRGGAARRRRAGGRRRRSRSTTLRRKSCRRAERPRETCHRKRCRDRPPRSERPPGLHRRRQPHALHQGARAARPVHAGRSRGRLRAAAAAAPAVRARRLRPGHPRLRQRHRRRDESGARRGAAARHGRGDDGLHGADQLRLRHAVDRHRLPVHPRRSSPI